MKWPTCSCPAEIDGPCKHVVVVISKVLDLSRQGLCNIPEARVCTEKLQMWHVRKPLTITKTSSVKIR